MGNTRHCTVHRASQMAHAVSCHVQVAAFDKKQIARNRMYDLFMGDSSETQCHLLLRKGERTGYLTP